MTDGDIVLRPTNSNINKRGPCALFFRLTLFQLQYHGTEIKLDIYTKRKNINLRQSWYCNAVPLFISVYAIY